MPPFINGNGLYHFDKCPIVFYTEHIGDRSNTQDINPYTFSKNPILWMLEQRCGKISTEIYTLTTDIRIDSPLGFTYIYK